MRQQTQLKLDPAGIRPRTDPALRVDNPMPGDIRAFGQGVESVTHLAGMARHSGQPGNLTVGCHPAPRNTSDDRVDAGMGVATLPSGHEVPSAYPPRRPSPGLQGSISSRMAAW